MSIMLTVVITDFNRKEYIKDSTLSALNQTLNKNEYEVIVSKTYRNNEIDEFLKEKGVTVITEENPINNSFLAKAIEISSGKILCFLDDDDLFTPWKLEFVVNSFNNNDRLGYIKNANIGFVDNQIPEKIPESKNYSEIYIKNEEKKTNFFHFMRYQPDGNSSSICIKKNILSNFTNLLYEINTAVDSFYFYSALSSHYDLLITPRVLTLRRYHYNNMSALYAKEFEKWLEKRKIFLNDYIKSLTIIRDKIATQNPFYNYLSFQISINKIYLSMLPGCKNKPDFSDYLAWLKLYKSNLKGILSALITLGPEPLKTKYARRLYKKSSQII